MKEEYSVMEIPAVDDLFDKDIRNIFCIRKSGGRAVYKAIYDGHQVILKNVKDSKRAETEFNNQKKAYNLLKSRGLKVPKPINLKGSWIVSEFIEGKKNQLGYEELQKSLRYLHILHSSDYSAIYPLNCHYYGQNLINRLKQEEDFLLKAIQKHPKISSFKNDFSGILKIAINYAFCDSPVAGHGDFQPNNIIVDKSEIIPIDWIDFGILLRWYDVGNLLFQQNGDELLSLVKYYLQLDSKQSNSSAEKVEEDVRKSLSIAFIIRTGSSFRHLVETNEDSSEHFRRIETNINYINEIFKSL